MPCPAYVQISSFLYWSFDLQQRHRHFSWPTDVGLKPNYAPPPRLRLHLSRVLRSKIDTPYAILSHRWTSEEVTYKEYLDQTYKVGPSMGKIRNACTEALRQGPNWLWIDTICIDKSSSAELTEAINSMYEWYSEAYCCLVHLADVHHFISLET